MSLEERILVIDDDPETARLLRTWFKGRDYGIEDATTGGIGKNGTDNSYAGNSCTANDIAGSTPSGLCQEEPVGLVNPSSGEWHLRHSAGDITTFYYGNPGDVPFMGDWYCDGVDTPGLFRQSDAFAYLRNSNSQGIADIRFYFGNPGDRLIAGDWSYDGMDTPALYRPSDRTFYLRYTNTQGNANEQFLWGWPHWIPVSGQTG